MESYSRIVKVKDLSQLTATYGHYYELAVPDQMMQFGQRVDGVNYTFKWYGVMKGRFRFIGGLKSSFFMWMKQRQEFSLATGW